MGSEGEMKVKDGKTFLQPPGKWAELGERVMGGERRFLESWAGRVRVTQAFASPKQPRNTM